MPLTCKELVELITNYLEGAMSAEERAQFEAHLAECVGCTVYLQQMRTTISLTGELREEHISPRAQITLMKMFKEWKNTSK
jgi:anti-sigma factor RsiW